MQGKFRLPGKAEPGSIIEESLAPGGNHGVSRVNLDLIGEMNTDGFSFQALPLVHEAGFFVPDDGNMRTPQRLLQGADSMAIEMIQMSQVSPDVTVAFDNQPPLSCLAVPSHRRTTAVERGAKPAHSLCFIPFFHESFPTDEGLNPTLR